MHVHADGRGAVPARSQQSACDPAYGRASARRRRVRADSGVKFGANDPIFRFFTPEVKASAAIDGTSFGGIGVQLAFDDASKQWRRGYDSSMGARRPGGLRPRHERGRRRHEPQRSDNAHVEALLPVRSVLPCSRDRRDGASLEHSWRRRAACAARCDQRLATVVTFALRSFSQDAGTKVRDALLALASKVRARTFRPARKRRGYESRRHVASAFIASGPIVANAGRDGNGASRMPT